MDLGSLIRLNHLFRISHCNNVVDFVDQLNYQYTGGVLLFFVGIISVRQYFGRPIQCWVPVHYSRPWTEYAEDICWTQSTYFLPSEKDVPQSNEETEKQLFITYYQWVTIFMGLQAIIAYLPYFIWFFSSRRFSTLITTLKKTSILDQEARKRSVLLVAGCIEEQFEMRKRRCGISGYRRSNKKICVLFFVSRLACIVLCCVQLYMMQVFLGMERATFGISVLGNICRGDQWLSSGHFPRITFCRFEIRDWKESLVKMETVQCALTINYFLEKMYIFLWFWFVALAVITTINTLAWMKRMHFGYSTDNFVRQYVNGPKICIQSDHNKDCRFFTKSFLGIDGVFLLLAISNSINDMIVVDVLKRLWGVSQQFNASANESEEKDDDSRNDVV